MPTRVSGFLFEKYAYFINEVLDTLPISISLTLTAKPGIIKARILVKGGFLWHAVNTKENPHSVPVG